MNTAEKVLIARNYEEFKTNLSEPSSLVEFSEFSSKS